MRILLQKALKTFAKHLLARHHPRVVAVTGTVGKTSAKEAIVLVLQSTYTIRTSKKNYNNEWGVPLTILGVESDGSAFGMLRALAWGAWNACFAHVYPEVLVLEFGIDKPGDMAYLTDIVKLDYAVITALGEIPVHVENFPSRDSLWSEKLAITKGLKPGGALFYNADDADLAARARNAYKETFSFGTSPTSNTHAVNVRALRDARKLIGIACTVVNAQRSFDLMLPKLVGTHQITSVLAAVAVGMACKVPEDCIKKALENFENPRGRLRFLSGIKGSFILDDTYNASPLSMRVALETLAACKPMHHIIAVLGDMLELGADTERAHREAGRHAAQVCDVLFAVGTQAKYIAEEAEKAGLARENIVELATSRDAGHRLREIIRGEDVVLVKGSQSMRMERTVECILAEPQKARELLVRQEKSWLKKP